MAQRVVFSESDIGRTLRRIAHEIIESTPNTGDLVLLGIPTRGAILADRLARLMFEMDGGPIACGTVDVTLYRDDLNQGGLRVPSPTHVPAGGIDDKIVVLVDDVLYSGRTVRAALDALTAIGRPRAVRLAVLVDRGHRELPIRADYVGKNLPSHHDERISVKLQEADGVEEVQVVP